MFEFCIRIGRWTFVIELFDNSKMIEEIHEAVVRDEIEEEKCLEHGAFLCPECFDYNTLDFEN